MICHLLQKVNAVGNLSLDLTSKTTSTADYLIKTKIIKDIIRRIHVRVEEIKSNS